MSLDKTDQITSLLRQSPDKFLRIYHAFYWFNSINQFKNARIADIGSTETHLQSLLQPDHYAIRVDRLNPQNARLFVRANGLHLPLSSKSFNYVFSLDVLEHIPASQRPNFLSELIRVAKDGIIISFPNNDPDLISLEMRLLNIQNLLGQKSDAFLDEHFSCGQVDPAGILEMLSSEFPYVQIESSFPLLFWYYFSILHYAYSLLPDNSEFMKAQNTIANYALLPIMDSSPSYRKFIIASHVEPSRPSMGMLAFCNAERQINVEDGIAAVSRRLKELDVYTRHIESEVFKKNEYLNKIQSEYFSYRRELELFCETLKIQLVEKTHLEVQTDMENQNLKEAHHFLQTKLDIQQDTINKQNHSFDLLRQDYERSLRKIHELESFLTARLGSNNSSENHGIT